MTDQAARGNGFTHIGTHESKNMSMTITLDAFIARRISSVCAGRSGR
jgi:hypothetical protein